MTHAITVDDDVYEALGALAVPFEDTPNSVIRRLLRVGSLPGVDALDDSVSDRDGQASSARAIPQPAYELPLLKVLVDIGGKATRAEALAALEREMSHTLTAVDRSPIPSGAIRWTKTASWAIKSMKFRGLVDPEGPWGYWAITDSGRAYLEAETKKRFL